MSNKQITTDEIRERASQALHEMAEILGKNLTDQQSKDLEDLMYGFLMVSHGNGIMAGVVDRAKARKLA